jgi:hypothetical protein
MTNVEDMLATLKAFMGVSVNSINSTRASDGFQATGAARRGELDGFGHRPTVGGV